MKFHFILILLAKTLFFSCFTCFAFSTYSTSNDDPVSLHTRAIIYNGSRSDPLSQRELISLMKEEFKKDDSINHFFDLSCCNFSNDEILDYLSDLEVIDSPFFLHFMPVLFDFLNTPTMDEDPYDDFFSPGTDLETDPRDFQTFIEEASNQALHSNPIDADEITVFKQTHASLFKIAAICYKDELAPYKKRLFSHIPKILSPKKWSSLVTEIVLKLKFYSKKCRKNNFYTTDDTLYDFLKRKLHEEDPFFLLPDNSLYQILNDLGLIPAHQREPKDYANLKKEIIDFMRSKFI
jgi:hypothetical protein